jgi:hypothetical protein
VSSLVAALILFSFFSLLTRGFEEDFLQSREAFVLLCFRRVGTGVTGRYCNVCHAFAFVIESPEQAPTGFAQLIEGGIERFVVKLALMVSTEIVLAGALSIEVAPDIISQGHRSATALLQPLQPYKSRDGEEVCTNPAGEPEAFVLRLLKEHDHRFLQHVVTIRLGTTISAHPANDGGCMPSVDGFGGFAPAGGEASQRFAFQV